MAEEVEWGPFDEDYETAGGVVGVVVGGGKRGRRVVDVWGKGWGRWGRL